jgi:ferredoxin
MTVQVDVHPDTAFFLTGRRAGEAGAGPALRPALLAAYRDLTKLRYDFPLVLRANPKDDPVFEPLTALTDRLIEGGADRQQALRVEREQRARTANIDGELVDCDAAMPARLLAHVWRATQEKKAQAFRRSVERLIVKLDDMLRADRARSAEGRSVASLKASFGGLHDQTFDFDSMSKFLGTVSVQTALSDSRRGRIASTLADLRAQRFYASGSAQALDFRFESCAAALRAFRERVPDMMRLAKAITLAELEVQGEFSSERHDALFERLAASGLDLRDLALFPDYLVCVREADVRGAELDALLEILAGGLPMKVLLQSDDLLDEPLAHAGHVAAGAHGRQLAHMALGLNSVYVLQASAAQLAVQRERLLQAMRFPGASLISVFSGASGHAGDLPPYLVAAAATESRAFPSFCYDPAAGDDWASRFSLAGNPQPERDWPLHALAYEDAEHQRVQAQVAFTLMDFAACDARYAEHFSAVPRAGRGVKLRPAAECVQRESKGVPDQLPGLLMADDANFVHHAIVDDRLLREARRCHEAWRSLQELGGIRNSHAERLVAQERARWEETRAVATPAPAPTPEAPAPAAAEPEAAPARSSDEPYIETPRCSSCDECIQLNGKMFAYDDNKQARIVDASAGTYRQLVEAAESCQVAIIHPGKPKNPDEPGLDELLKRAEAFA